MSLVDMRTVFLSYAASNAVCVGLIALLWLQNRKHFTGLGSWLAGFAMQLAAITLIALRGIAPDILSMVAGNTSLMLGTLLLYVGLESFVDRRSQQVHNLILLVIFAAVHTYFSIFQPSLAARNINLSLGLLVLFAQAAWLMLKRVDVEMRPITRTVGIIFVAFCLISVVRIIVDLVAPPENGFFRPDSLDTVLLFAYQLPFIMLAFSLPLMVNQRLFVDLERDITEREQVESALRSSEEKFFKAFYSSPDAIFISRLSDGQITEVNEGFCRLTGYLDEEALSSTVIDLGLWANPQDREQCVAELRDKRSIHDKEYDFRIKSGAIVSGLYSGEIIYLGTETYMLSVVRDITARKRAEEALRQSEEHLKMSQEIAHLGSWELDLSSKRLTWSDEVYRIFGLEPQAFDATYEAFLEMVHPDDRAVVDEAYSGSIREERDTYEVEHRIVRKNTGEIRYVHEKCKHARDPSGKVVRSIGMVHDVTERRRAEDALRQSERKLRGIVEQSPDGVTVTDEQGLIITWNPAMEHITGLKASEVIGEPVWDAQFRLGFEARKTPDHYREIEEMATEVLRAGQAPWLGELIDTRYQHPDGTYRFVQSVTFPIRTDRGFMIGSVVRDITEHRRAEEIVRLRLRLWEYANTHSVSALMQKALDEIGELTNSPISFYHFVEEDQNTLSLQAWSTRTQQEF